MENKSDGDEKKEHYKEDPQESMSDKSRGKEDALYEAGRWLPRQQSRTKAEMRSPGLVIGK